MGIEWVRQITTSDSGYGRNEEALLASSKAKYPKALLLATIIAIVIAFSHNGFPQNISGDTFAEAINAEYFGKMKLDKAYTDYRGANFMSRVDLDGVNFDSIVNFNGATFNSIANFREASFLSTAYFGRAKFLSAAIFGWTGFHSEADFIATTFSSINHFGITTFRSRADFSYATFDCTAYFRIAHFCSSASFYKATFTSGATFRSANFDSLASFSGTTFSSLADFGSVNFNSAVNFSYAEFDSKADFNCAVFRGDVSFYVKVLPEIMDMRYVRIIGQPLDLTHSGKTQSGNRCKICLTRADVDKIWINMRLFELYFPIDTIRKASYNVDNDITCEKHKPTFFGVFELVDNHNPGSIGDFTRYKNIGDSTWVDSPSYDDQVAVYEGLLNQFRGRGLKESYEMLDKEYHQFLYAHKGWIHHFIVDPFQRIWWDYGYNPELIFFWTGVWWLLFSLINLRYFARLNEGVYCVDFLGPIESIILRIPLTWMQYSFQTLLYTAFIFFGLKLNLDKFPKGVIKKHPFLLAYLMIIYTCGLVCMGFIANIVFAK